MRYFQTITIDKVGGETMEVDMVRTIDYKLGDDMTVETNYIIHPTLVRVMDFPLLRGDREEKNLPSTYSEKSIVDGEPVWEEITKGDFENLIRGLKQHHSIYKEG